MNVAEHPGDVWRPEHLCDGLVDCAHNMLHLEAHRRAWDTMLMAM